MICTYIVHTYINYEVYKKEGFFGDKFFPLLKVLKFLILYYIYKISLIFYNDFNLYKAAKSNADIIGFYFYSFKNIQLIKLQNLGDIFLVLNTYTGQGRRKVCKSGGASSDVGA